MQAWRRLVCCVLALAAVPAAAQTPAAPVRVEASAGVGWGGGRALDARDAALRANAPDSEPYRLFSTESRVTGARTLDVRLGLSLGSRLGVEGRLGVGRPELRSAVSDDVEGVPDQLVVQRVDQYLVEAGFVVRLPEWRLRAFEPFVTAGVGYVRQLHEGRAHIEHGRLGYAGVGGRYWLRSRARGFAKAVGLRADARLEIVRGGLDPDGGPSPRGAVMGAVVVGF